MPATYAQVIERVHMPLAQSIRQRSQACEHLVVGLCGSQGSGKSTMARGLRSLLEAQGVSCVILSIDDLYLTRAEREALGKHIHPLFVTRGVPGTHDVQLGIETIEALKRSRAVALPAFDKSTDDRKPIDEWPRLHGPIQVVLFEGWCVGAAPQNETELARPVNVLEREHDFDGTWRRFVNDALRTEYPKLFASLDALVFLQAPSFDVVYAWRLEQERRLRERLKIGGQPTRIMSDEEVATFVAHYERLTRHMLSEMPARADVVVNLSEKREPLALTIAGPGAFGGGQAVRR